MCRLSGWALLSEHLTTSGAFQNANFVQRTGKVWCDIWPSSFKKTDQVERTSCKCDVVLHIVIPSLSMFVNSWICIFTVSPYILFLTQAVQRTKFRYMIYVIYVPYVLKNPFQALALSSHHPMAPPISSCYQPVGQECSCGKANLKEYACSEIATGATDSAMSSDEPFCWKKCPMAQVVREFSSCFWSDSQRPEMIGCFGTQPSKWFWRSLRCSAEAVWNWIYVVT